MNCEEIRKLIREGRPTEGSAEEHLGACGECAAERRFWEGVRSALRRTEPPPPFLHSRIMAGVRAEARALAERGPWYFAGWMRRWALPALAAAVVFVGQGAGLTALFRPLPDDLVVRWSEEQALLLAQNAAPVRRDQETSDLSASLPSRAPDTSPPEDAPEEVGATVGTRSSEDFAPERPGSSSGAPTADRADEAQGESDLQEFQHPLELAQMKDRTESQAPPPARETLAMRAGAPTPAGSAPDTNREKEGLAMDRSEVRKRESASGDAFRAPAPSAGSPPAKRDAPPTLLCRVERDGVPMARVEISATVAPAQGDRLAFRVEGSGRVTLLPTQTLEQAPALDLARTLESLGLAPGAYTLTR